MYGVSIASSVAAKAKMSDFSEDFGLDQFLGDETDGRGETLAAKGEPPLPSKIPPVLLLLLD